MTAVVIHKSPNPKFGLLVQGGADDVAQAGDLYDLIVLCADEFQPKAHIIAAPGVRVVHAPNDDSGNPLTRAQTRIAIRASREVERAFLQGQRILVSCFQGRNRSGLVMALALHRLYGLSGSHARKFIRDKIPFALTNPDFNRFLERLPGKTVSP